MSETIGQHSGLLSPWVDAMRMKKVAGHIPPNSRVLDIGCGPGMLIPLLPENTSYVGVDIDHLVIESNRKKFPEHFFREAEAGSSVLPFNNEAFDVVVLAAFLEHLENPRILLSEVSRVLKLSGVVIATTPSPMGGWLHEILASVHLLSHEAAEDHEDFLNKAKLEACLPLTGLSLSIYKTFQMGLNQLFILKKEPR